MESSTPRPGADPGQPGLTSSFEPNRARAGLGDFSEFFASHRAFVRRNLLRLGVSEASVDDASQELFIRAYRRRDDYQGQASPRCWLFAFVRRVAASYRRSEHRRNRRHRAHAELLQLEGGPPTDGDRWETRRLVAQLLAGLSQQDRDLIILVDLEGVSGPELAASRDLELSVAYTQIRAARRRARKRLQALQITPQSQSATKYSPAGAPLLIDFPQLSPAMSASAIAQAGAGWAPALAVVKTGAVTTSVLGLKISAGALAATTLLALSEEGSLRIADPDRHDPIVRHQRNPILTQTRTGATTPESFAPEKVEARKEAASPTPRLPAKQAPSRPRAHLLGREIELLEAAQAAFVVGNLEQTSQLLQRAEGEFPAGSLRRERAQLRARVERALRSPWPRPR